MLMYWAEALRLYKQILFASREIGLEVNAETNKCMASVQTRMQGKS